ncbi:MULTISPECIES: hypothetical protein [Rhodopseudomonas]|uniref:hypothetical protein n=1 Tax=Rhodopseudomonas TaxID=1073 RepID=UPI001569C3F3|nr:MULTISPECIES: hypothetical protein [Rhodopseudomonas]MDF3810455.1 hypothetical protein [Rhodopseudomonas sp. BAL398]WOK20873.1 hypothetical protein RBJ75_18795 [Rhodopseudomonas sp. BAL398]
MTARTIDVHDNKVRRIDVITPDMVCPNRTTPRPISGVGVVFESSDIILIGTRPVRVQTVNAASIA